MKSYPDGLLQFLEMEKGTQGLDCVRTCTHTLCWTKGRNKVPSAGLDYWRRLARRVRPRERSVASQTPGSCRGTVCTCQAAHPNKTTTLENMLISESHNVAFLGGGGVRACTHAHGFIFKKETPLWVTQDRCCVTKAALVNKTWRWSGLGYFSRIF